MVKRTKTQIEKRKKALEMLKKGAPIEEIMRETKLNYQQITGLKGYLTRVQKGNPPKPPQMKTQRVQGASAQTPSTEKDSNPTDQTLGTSGDKAEGLMGEVGVPSRTLSGTGKNSDMGLGGEGYPLGQAGEILERELWVKATPIIRKVVLNPVVYLYYDYVREKYGYQGDLGDFLYDCVEDFFRSRGVKIKIVKEDEVSG